MKTFLLVAFCTLLAHIGFGQKKDKSEKTKEKLLKELSANACKCVDSIETFNKANDVVAGEIGKCIDEVAGAYQLGSKLAEIDTKKDDKSSINISISEDKNSNEYKKYYYELERYMRENCQSLQTKVASTEKQNSAKSVSSDSKALEFFTKGQNEIKKQHYKEAAALFEKSVSIDDEFAFAWDNLGFAYRNLGQYDKAIEAYERSLQIDPKGLMPLQNIAIVYQYKKEFDKAIDAYKRLAEIDKNNPEVYYGIGQVYTINMNDFEQGLENICKAYNLYVEQKSPYRADAEKLIQVIYAQMKKQGKEDKFKEILKAHNINPQ